MFYTKQAKRGVPASSEMLLELLPGALFVVDDETTILYANARALACAGMAREKIFGQSFWRCMPRLVSIALYQAIQKTKQTRESTEVTYVSSVTNRLLHASLSPLEHGLALLFLEPQESLPPQHTLNTNEQMYRDLLESFADGVTIVTPDGLILDINQRPLIDGYLDKEKVVGKPFSDLPSWSSDPTVRQCLQTAIEQASQGETVRFEARIHPRPGHFLDILMTITSHRDANQQVEYLICAGRDITERKHAEDELRTLVDTIPQFVWIAEPDGQVTYNNQRAIDYLAMTREQTVGTGWLSGIHPDERQQVQQVWRTAIETGRPYELEHRMRDGTSGEYRRFLVRGIPQKNAGGAILRWVGTATDIEEQKRTEEALRQSQERVNALMNSAIIGINVIEGRHIVDANDTFLRMTGYTREDLQSRRLNVIDITVPEDRERTRQAHQEMVVQQVLTPYEKEYICQDGQRLPVLVGGVFLQQHPFQAIGFVLDNSARKELEQRKDTFISMASHELRNPLTALQLQTTLLRRQLARQGTIDQAPALARMERQLATVIRLVEELLDVSKIQAGRLEYIQEPVDLNALLQEIIETLQHTSPHHRIQMQSAAQATVTGDRDRLGQVFTNLLSNAIKYSPGARTVEVDLSTSLEQVTVRVHDHGLGIPREQRDKIFERFYRVTNSRQKSISGLGMGLYVVAEIVKRHKGAITVDSTLGEGSTFTVTLPMQERTR